MKTFILTLLLTICSFASYAQDAWPRNPKTGNVEFKGTLSWPPSAKTEEQQRALVRRWYLVKLTDLTATEVESQAATNKSNGLLTYAGLPKASVLRQREGDIEYLLGCFMQLSPASTGLAYNISLLSFDKASEVESHEPTPLEELMPNATSSEQAALAALRKRLALALASWY